MNTAVRSASRHIPALDGLRGLAVAMVVMFHTTEALPFRVLTGFGWMGVDLFFVLSGFLITGILLDRKGTPRYYPNFLLRRSLRIFPLYFGALAVVFIGMSVSGNEQWKLLLDEQWRFWTYTQNLWFAFNGWPKNNFLLNHFWSLAIEEQFYLFWPWVVALVGPRWLARICIAGSLLALCIRIGAPNVVFAYTFTLARLDCLFLGALAQLLMRFRPALAERSWLPVGLGAALVFAGIVLASRSNYFVHPAIYTFGFTAIAVMFTSTLLATFSPSRLGAASRWFFEMPLLRWLGRYSYGVYVFHWFLFDLLHRVALERILRTDVSQRMAEVVFLLGFYPLLLVVSYASYHLFEMRFLRLKKNF